MIDLPPTGGRLFLGRREGLLADMRLAGPSAEIVDFGGASREAAAARAPLRNHSLDPERMRLSGETGGALLLGRRTGQAHRPERLSGGPEPGNAGGLY